MLNMTIETHRIDLDFSNTDVQSMLILGKTRHGKTFFASLLGNKLKKDGNSVQLIDLGNTWSQEDKCRLKNNVEIQHVTTHFHLHFPSDHTLLQAAKEIALSLGFSSENAKTVIKDAIKKVFLRDGKVPLAALYDELKLSHSPTPNCSDENPYLTKVLERFEDDILPDVTLHVNPNPAAWLKSSSYCCIWDLSTLSTDMAKLVANLILLSNLSLKTAIHRVFKSVEQKTFLIIDEFQNLDIVSHSILGKVLTEGMKHKLFTILITQFLSEKFSDHVRNQLDQSGFFITFHLENGPDAKAFVKKHSHDNQTAKAMLNIVTSLKVGECIIDGPLILDNKKHISGPKLIKISEG